MPKAIVFRDKVKVYATAGNGGDGCSSFRREKFVPRGGPDGGNGGRGGNVVLKASKDESSLVSIYFQPHQRAEHGGRGKGKQLDGRNGKDLYARVPLGTEVRVLETDELLGELLEDGDELIVARGGIGGRGNATFKSSTNQAPTKFTEGTKGEELTLLLTLKVVADVGLVGYPNAGKSTLLTALSDAHPKVAPYPFTTLNPMIGTVIFDDFQRIQIADIPGLIEGAHEGVGLGHDFLRHIERTRFLVFVIDIAGVDGRKPHEDYLSLRKELTAYKPELNDLPYLVVANKTDMPEAEENLETFQKETGEIPLQTCAELREGTDDLLQAIYDRLCAKSD